MGFPTRRRTRSALSPTFPSQRTCHPSPMSRHLLERSASWAADDLSLLFSFGEISSSSWMSQRVERRHRDALMRLQGLAIYQIDPLICVPESRFGSKGLGFAFGASFKTAVIKRAEGPICAQFGCGLNDADLLKGATETRHLRRRVSLSRDAFRSAIACSVRAGCGSDAAQMCFRTSVARKRVTGSIPAFLLRLD